MLFIQNDMNAEEASSRAGEGGMTTYRWLKVFL